MCLSMSGSTNSQLLEERERRHFPRLYTSRRDENATVVPVLGAIRLHRSKHSAFVLCLSKDTKQDSKMMGLGAGGRAFDRKVKI